MAHRRAALAHPEKRVARRNAGTRARAVRLARAPVRRDTAPGVSHAEVRWRAVEPFERIGNTSCNFPSVAVGASGPIASRVRPPTREARLRLTTRTPFSVGFEHLCCREDAGPPAPHPDELPPVSARMSRPTRTRTRAAPVPERGTVAMPFFAQARRARAGDVRLGGDLEPSHGPPPRTHVLMSASHTCRSSHAQGRLRLGQTVSSSSPAPTCSASLPSVVVVEQWVTHSRRFARAPCPSFQRMRPP